MTKQATEAKAVDNAHRLEMLKTKLLDESFVAYEELHAPVKVFNWHKGEFNEHEITEPTATDKRNIMWRLGGCVANYRMIVDVQGGGGDEMSSVDEWLDAMGGGE